jgi:hypothetical protein
MSLKILLMILLVSGTVSAQLAIQPGAQFAISGNMQLTLQNTDLVNNGSFMAGSGVASFSGNSSSSISGSQPVQFFELDINKSTGSSVFLHKPIVVAQRIFFSSGFLDLNGFNTDLGTTGRLDNEQESSRITGANGGQVVFSTTLNSPVAANPANLGALISSAQNLGNVIIKRGHRAQQGIGLTNSIQRFYDIIPTNNTALNATLRFKYFNAELNGLLERGLVIFRSTDTVNWSEMGFTSQDTSSNFLEQTGIPSFFRWTLSEDSRVLATRFISVEAGCTENKVQVNWTTAEEQNSSHYDIERSGDGIPWTVIGILKAIPDKGSERTYSFTDNSPLQKGYYRIAQYDADGSVQYSRIVPSACNPTDAFSVSPNPAHNSVMISLVSSSESAADIMVFDTKGALVKIQNAHIIRGDNQIQMELGTLPNGVYVISVEWNNGQTKKATKLIKQ